MLFKAYRFAASVSSTVRRNWPLYETQYFSKLFSVMPEVAEAKQKVFSTQILKLNQELSIGTDAGGSCKESRGLINSIIKHFDCSTFNLKLWLQKNSEQLKWLIPSKLSFLAVQIQVLRRNSAKKNNNIIQNRENWTDLKIWPKR